VGRVGLGQSADGLGCIGLHKMDPWTTLSWKGKASATTLVFILMPST